MENKDDIYTNMKKEEEKERKEEEKENELYEKEEHKRVKKETKENQAFFGWLVFGILLLLVVGFTQNAAILFAIPIAIVLRGIFR